MKAGIIAAGLGERLRSAGTVKPLVPVAGRPLVHWTVAGLQHAGVDSITILLNTKGGEVRRSLAAAFPKIDWRFLEWDSPSSWESFRRVSVELAAQAERFLVSTVDALARPDDVARFAARAKDSDAALAVTPFIDDEKPLWADSENGRIVAVGADSVKRDRATCGLYGLSRRLAAGLPEQKHERLRDYWTSLCRSGVSIAAVELEKTIDVDRPEDLAVAEDFLRSKV
ncbi:MAG: NTP transferase domain-containing protein [Elusimicrobia bacterium]|nr:NTP transferase domain-containing protein [Elusimicrobiota bacterium]